MNYKLMLNAECFPNGFLWEILNVRMDPFGKNPDGFLVFVAKRDVSPPAGGSV